MSDLTTYFAYGSNLCPDQMAIRCPDHEVISVASLQGHELCFPRSSLTRGGGVASLQENANSIVWGVIYKVSKSDIESLDICEAIGVCYNKKKILVQTNAGPIEAFSYIAIKEEGLHYPTQDYLNIILKGLHHRVDEIPHSYIEFISNIKTK